MGQSGFSAARSVLKKSCVGAHSPHISLEDDAVADGGQQIVEVELMFVVGGIPAVLLPRFHQCLSKPAMSRIGGEMLFDTFGKKKSILDCSPIKEVLHFIQPHLYSLISKGFSDHQSHPHVLLQHLPQSRKSTGQIQTNKHYHPTDR